MTHPLPMLGENLDRVLVGDCVELMQRLPEASVDMRRSFDFYQGSAEEDWLLQPIAMVGPHAGPDLLGMDRTRRGDNPR